MYYLVGSFSFWGDEMTPEKCREVVKFYKDNLVKFFTRPRRIDIKQYVIEPYKMAGHMEKELAPWLDAEEDIMAHMLYMLGEMERFIDEGRMEKFFRWLGFIQGFCWTVGYQTLEELKNLNKPNPYPDTGEATVGDPSTAEIAI
jgi:hypothetical protein